MSEKAQAFVKANDASPVVSGYAIEPNPMKPPKGGCYTLKDGRRFRLGVIDCRALPEGYPRWDLEPRNG